MDDDPYDLERFVIEQDRDGNFERAVNELRAGRKRSDWIWFVFPQLHRDDLKPYSARFAIRSREEAIAYLEHDVLGPRLRRCTRLVARSGAVSARVLMGSSVDESKLKSSMTLFAEVSGEDDDFVAVLREYFPGGRDQETLKKLKPTSPRLQESSQTKHRRRRWPRRRRTED
ncbi:hypothetical protein MycrhN_0879 [Mycolicibacterium rhodesiae NBB3]|uniref:Calpastatin n=1 Tax=Mycolicibacterium rhodesiae (strain NBB3) TaxID=710685 RepID=G8RRR8_MYCRN|nr:hypothetical protein MycrhN_0879 [Mycolicibacterium rhodesiae NBB3]